MKIEQREQGMAAILEGELGHREALEAMRSLEDAIDSYAPSSLELDFSGVSFMDSSGIAVVVQAARQMQAAGGSLRCPALPVRPCGYFRRRASPGSSASSVGRKRNETVNQSDDAAL